MTETITHAFVSKSEADAPDPANNFPGKQNVAITATYDGQTKPFEGLIATDSSFSDEQYGDAYFNAIEGHIYVTFGLPDPTQD
tara:strand:+ start:355 stop:603 length:249 start_codon:yes stop_codon:yes gene_type:complete